MTRKILTFGCLNCVLYLFHTFQKLKGDWDNGLSYNNLQRSQATIPLKSECFFKLLLSSTFNLHNNAVVFKIAVNKCKDALRASLLLYWCQLLIGSNDIPILSWTGIAAVGAVVAAPTVMGAVPGIGSGERIFPPQAGLTFSTWVCIDRYSSPNDDPHPVRLLTIARQFRSLDSTVHNVPCLTISISARDKMLTVCFHRFIENLYNSDLRKVIFLFIITILKSLVNFKVEWPPLSVHLCLLSTGWRVRHCLIFHSSLSHTLVPSHICNEVGLSQVISELKHQVFLLPQRPARTKLSCSCGDHHRGLQAALCLRVCLLELQSYFFSKEWLQAPTKSSINLCN